MSAPLVSLIMPCYNASQWVGAALESAFSQQWPHCEVILVDDGSSDDSVQQAQAYQARGLKLIQQDNRGAAAARNRGLAEARGDFIQFLDADDLLSADKISAQMALLMQAPRDTVASARWARFAHDPALADPAQRPVYRNYTAIEYLLDGVTRNAVMHPGAWLVPRSIVERIGPWCERLNLNDDTEYFARVALASSGIRFCDEGLSYYRSFNLNTLSHRRDAAARESCFLSFKLVCEHLLAFEDSPRTRQACARLYQSYIRHMYPSPRARIREAEAQIAALAGREQVPGLLDKLGFVARMQMMRLLQPWLRLRSRR